MGKKWEYVPDRIISGTVDGKVFVCTCKAPNGEMIFCIPKYSHPPEKWEKSSYRHRVKKKQILSVNFEDFEARMLSLNALYREWTEGEAKDEESRL